VHARELAHRLDYRTKAVFTIDPDDAKDFDDALSYEVLEGGDVRVGIHIADVSTYVVQAPRWTARPASRQLHVSRGVVVPMLPEKLSNGLCSLVEGQDRLCKAVFLTVDKKGRIKETTFANTVIRSRKRLTYKAGLRVHVRKRHRTHSRIAAAAEASDGLDGPRAARSQ
jgi:ribonuclease R